MQKDSKILPIYRFPIPYSVDEIMEATRETVRANKLDSAYIRPLGFVGNVGLGVCPPANTEMESLPLSRGDLT